MGSQCRHLHDWTDIEDKNTRCCNFSSSNHIKPDCPYRGRQNGQSKASIEGSSGGEVGKGLIAKQKEQERKEEKERKEKEKLDGASKVVEGEKLRTTRED